MAPKTFFKASGSFYNNRALQRTSNQGNRMLRKKKRTQWKVRHVQISLSAEDKSCFVGASTTPRLYNARRIKVVGCLGKKERNENDARLNSKDFRIFRAFLNFLQLFLRSKVSTQAPVKFFLWLQKHCSKHLGASTTQWLYNARGINFIGCLEKKERNENSDVCKFHS